MTSTPLLTSSDICSVMAPIRDRDTWPFSLVRTEVPAFTTTRRAVRKMDREAGSFRLGIVTVLDDADDMLLGWLVG